VGERVGGAELEEGVSFGVFVHVSWRDGGWCLAYIDFNVASMSLCSSQTVS